MFKQRQELLSELHFVYFYLLLSLSKKHRYNELRTFCEVWS